MIERICEICGKHFFVKPYSVKKGQGRFCSRKCWGASPEWLEIAGKAGKYERTKEHRRAISERDHRLFAGKPKSEEHKRKIGEANRGNKRPDFAAIVKERAAMGLAIGPNNSHYGKPHTDEAKQKIRNKRLAYIARTPIEERRLSEETKTKISEIRKRDWQNPEYIAKLMQAMGVKPNKLERKFMVLAAKHFPQFKYNGDGRLGVSPGGLTPDFVNTNEEKELIEIFGDYYHSPEVIGDDWRRSELGKLMIYNSVGWDCLVIWEHELKELTEEEIVDKISSFSRRR